MKSDRPAGHRCTCTTATCRRGALCDLRAARLENPPPSKAKLCPPPPPPSPPCPRGLQSTGPLESVAAVGDCPTGGGVPPAPRPRFPRQVTICTELRYKAFIHDAGQGLSRGCVRFRPSGGDTMERTDTAVARWAMQCKMDLMQATMMARGEAEFFPSIHVCVHWAEVLQPSLIVFGFTMATIAAIASEKYGIPVVGFILQPTCIPSQHYSAVVPIGSHWSQAFGDLVSGHAFKEVRLGANGPAVIRAVLWDRHFFFFNFGKDRP